MPRNGWMVTLDLTMIAFFPNQFDAALFWISQPNLDLAWNLYRVEDGIIRPD